MFCNQCEQTFRGTGCTDVGVCGKDGQGLFGRICGNDVIAQHRQKVRRLLHYLAVVVYDKNRLPSLLGHHSNVRSGWGWDHPGKAGGWGA